jgi:hypothetical protein
VGGLKLHERRLRGYTSDGRRACDALWPRRDLLCCACADQASLARDSWRWLQVPVRKGVGSNPAGVIRVGVALVSPRPAAFLRCLVSRSRRTRQQFERVSKAVAQGASAQGRVPTPQVSPAWLCFCARCAHRAWNGCDARRQFYSCLCLVVPRVLLLLLCTAGAVHHSFTAVARLSSSRGGYARAGVMDCTTVTSPRSHPLPMSCSTNAANQQLEGEGSGGLPPVTNAPCAPDTIARLRAQDAERPADPGIPLRRAAGNLPALRHSVHHAIGQRARAVVGNELPRSRSPDRRRRGHDGPNSRRQRASGMN